jgi:hypothetical protein
VRDLDKALTEKLFGDLMEGIELDARDVPKSELRIVPMDYKRVGLNLFEGEELHEALREANQEGASFLASIGAQVGSVPMSRDVMIDAMQQSILDHRLEHMFGELVAVEGVGWFGIQKPEQSTTLKTGLLAETERLFGRPGGLGYGKYQVISREAMRLLLEERIQPEDDIRIGGFIGLTDARVCRGDIDGLGEEDEHYEKVVVPVDVSAFRWSRAYPLE